MAEVNITAVVLGAAPPMTPMRFGRTAHKVMGTSANIPDRTRPYPKQSGTDNAKDFSIKGRTKGTIMSRIAQRIKPKY
ncbi:hypothetical protein PITCH_A2030070 [uncultured Desulfobacterium sp.]|uniref:Uncharacterized protein n=1 Tax=uncultured Desulfobacterium sp. TaxID=201089 RepID=A0A445MWQ7_9BACT|nr:hypothetical protein PITCH_A2030070 [uncultured Desulfobacterium sp.]